MFVRVRINVPNTTTGQKINATAVSCRKILRPANDCCCSKRTVLYECLNECSPNLPIGFNVWPLLTRLGSIAQDEEALRDFFNDTNGPQWSQKEGWLQSRDLHQWIGVRVKKGRVVWLLKNQHNVTGKKAYVPVYMSHCPIEAPVSCNHSGNSTSAQ